MIGVVLVSHGNIAREMIRIAEFIVGTLEQVVTISTDPEQKPEQLEKIIRHAIRQVDQGQGVVILTDMFGGTPSNLSLSFLEKGKVEVVSGMNLPMLLKLYQREGKQDLEAFARELKTAGQQHISIASELMSEQKSS